MDFPNAIFAGGKGGRIFLESWSNIGGRKLWRNIYRNFERVGVDFQKAI